MTPEDGDIGFLVRRHWTGWVPYWVVAPPVAVAILVANWYAWWRGDMPLAGWWLLVPGGSLLIVVKLVVLWYHKLAREVLLVTPIRVYAQTQDQLFSYSSKIVETKEIASARAYAETLGGVTFRYRTVEIVTMGDHPNIVYRHAAEWEDLEQGVSRVLALAPRA